MGIVGVDEDHIPRSEGMDVARDSDIHRSRHHKEQLQAIVPMEPRISQLVDKKLHRDAFAKVDDLMPVFQPNLLMQIVGTMFASFIIAHHPSKKTEGSCPQFRRNAMDPVRFFAA